MIQRTARLLALGAALGLALTACKKPAPEKPATAQLLAHLDAQIKLLQDNQAEPEKALAEVAAYQEKHGPGIRQLERAYAETLQKDPMKVAAFASLYGMKSAELEGRTAEARAKVQPK
jgi:TorA maturation chaperone TorD